MDRPRGPIDFKSGSIVFVGAATVLIRYAGFTILTDPNFLHRGDHARLGYGIRSRRLTEPALSIDELPALDLVVLSHLHGDHWDDVADARLPRSLPVVTTPEAADRLARRGFNASEGLDTWDALECTTDAARVRVTSVPARHGPQLVSRLLPTVMGSFLEFEMLDGRRLLRIYVSGDTLVHERVPEIRARYGEADVALLHLGGERILGILLTMDARQALQMLRLVRPRTAIPIHYDDYPIFRSSLLAFEHLVKAAHLQEQVHFLAHGQTFTFDVPAARISRPA